MHQLDITILTKMWPRGNCRKAGLLEGIVKTAPAILQKYNIVHDITLANMMGEFTEECGGGTEIEENLNYRASALVAQWPSHFSWEQAMAMQHQPYLIANQAYNGRMGNRIGTNDGWNYRGRGPSQITGREAYQQMSDAMKVDFVDRPDLVNDPQYFFEVGVLDFVLLCKCLSYAERDDEVNETRHLNGGLIGLRQREISIGLWKREFGL